MSKYGRLAKSVGDAAGAGLDAAKSAAKSDAAKRVAKSMDDVDGDMGKFDPTVLLKRGAKGLDNDAVEAFKGLLRKGGLSKAETKKLAKTMSKAAEGLTDKQVMDGAGASLAKTGKALKDSKSFWEKNKVAFLAAGVSAVGIALATLIANSKPEDVTEVTKKSSSSPSKDPDDEDPDDEDPDDEDPDDPDGTAPGLKKFFKKYTVHIMVGVGVMILLGVLAFVISRRGNNDSNGSNSV
jgi:hypothetical protein